MGRVSRCRIQRIANLQKGRISKAKRLASGHDLRKRESTTDYATLNTGTIQSGKSKRNGIKVGDHDRGAQVAQSTSTLTTLQPSFNGTDLFLEVKEEDGVEEAIEMNIDVDEYNNADLEQQIDPLLCDKSIGISCQGQEQEGRCLICFCQDSDLQPLTKILPKPKKKLTNPEHLDEEDESRIIQLLNIIFQWSKRDLRNLDFSKAEGLREWIHLCQSCRLLVSEVQTLEDRMRKCRKKIKNRLLKSTKLSSSSSMTPLREGLILKQRIRNLVNRQVKSSKKDTASIDGDRDDYQAGEINESELKRTGQRSESELLQCRDLERLSAFSDPQDSGVLVEDEGELSGDVDGPSGKIDSATAISATKPFNEFYICPYCTSDTVSTDAAKMDVVELYYHLIFHHDYPMKCTECKIFLAEDSPTLDAHWYQCHSGLRNIIPAMRFTKTEIKTAPGPVTSELGERNPTTPPKKMNQSSILCTDCLTDNNLEVEFETMKEFKIHQALKHPSVARSSCPLCPLVFSEEPKNSEENKAALKEHLKTVHKIYKKDLWRSYLCKLCGRGIKNISKDELLPAKFAHAEMLHLMSRHVHFIQAMYTCTGCSKEFSDFKKLIDHAYFNPNHPKVTWNTRANYLFNFKKNQITCGLCFDGEQSSFDSGNIDAFFCHLNVGHSVVFEWNAESLEGNGKVNLSKAEIHIEEMAEICEVFQRNEKEIRKKISLVNGNATTTRPPKYACPSCPNLKRMNLDAFLVHLVFHWRRPNRCILCKSYLPFNSDAIEAHWKEYHADVNTTTAVKYEPVLFTPGNVSRCEKCPERFTSFGDRNEHELSFHGWRSIKTENCSACKECFPSKEELRLHRAIDHPVIASVSCYFCEETFPAESLEGVKYLDCEALKKHILEKDDHPKYDNTKTMFHLCACDFCGKVVEDSTKTSIHLRTHILQRHLQGKVILAKNVPLWCFICNKELRQLSVWDHFSKMHARNCICDTCGEEMRPRTLPDHTLVKHDVLMEGFKEFSCVEEGCSYKTVYSASLKRHVFVHHTDRQRSHKCSICGKAFFVLSNLREHEERHQNKETRPFQCEICGGSYAVRNDLYIHKRLSHLNMKFPSTNRKRTKRKRSPVAVTNDQAEADAN